MLSFRSSTESTVVGAAALPLASTRTAVIVGDDGLVGGDPDRSGEASVLGDSAPA